MAIVAFFTRKISPAFISGKKSSFYFGGNMNPEARFIPPVPAGRRRAFTWTFAGLGRTPVPP